MIDYNKYIKRIAEVLRANRYSPVLSCCRDADEHAVHQAEKIMVVLERDLNKVGRPR